MSGLEALLKVQEFDLEADRLRARRKDLEESREIEQCKAAMAELDVAHAATQGRREQLAKAERALGAEVEGVASKAKAADTKLYSGTVKVAKELVTLEEELQSLRARQSELEDLEMQQLEAIDEVESELADLDARRGEQGARLAKLEDALRVAEDAIDGELARIETPRGEAAGTLPGPVTEEYDRLRENPRLGGRVAARLRKGICEGCRVKLPINEDVRIRAETPEAVVCCVGCRRLLVR